jgi:Na+/H+ antiporter NhaD/arsenite permease-like protein
VLTNVTTVLIMCPVVVMIALQLEISPVPFAIALVIASNTGGVATLTGCPTNIMVGSEAGLDFMDFLVNLGPVILINFVVFCVLMLLMCRKKLAVSDECKERIMKINDSKLLTNKPLLIKSAVVVAIMFTGFIVHRRFDVEASVIALAAASVLMLISGQDDVEAHMESVELPTMLFFTGLFILVQGMVETGWMDKAAQFIVDSTQGNAKLTSVLLLWICGGISAFVNNVPFAATMIPMIKGIAESTGGDAGNALWWALSLGVVIGGNATLTGAAANLIAASICERNGYKIGFRKFAKYGVPVTLANLGICTAYLAWRYF